jgi:hypothetical protein
VVLLELGLINQIIVEPYIDKAVNIEVQNSVREGGEAVDPNELVKYRTWQKGGEIVAGTILGISIAALFGIVFAYSRSSVLLLPHSDNNKKKALVLAAIMWFVLFLIPALKYSKRIAIPLIYAAIIIGAFLILPPNPDKITAPMDLVLGFRIASGFTISVFWGLLALIFGSFWDRLKPHETTRITTV